MSEHANPARGEQEIEIDGEIYVFVSTFGRIAKLQTALGVKGLFSVQQAIFASDSEVLMKCVECLARHGDPKKLEAAPFHSGNVARLVIALLNLFRDPNAPEEPEKNVPGAEEAKTPI